MMLYFVDVLLLWSLGVAQSSDISQPVPFQTAELGDSATIKCYIKSELEKRVWYKYTTAKRLQLVAAFHMKYNRSVFADESHRYSVKFDRNNNHLSISATTWDDAGTYFCGVLHLNKIQFGSGTFLMVKGTNMISDSEVRQLGSKSVQPGDSVTLTCYIHTGLCAAEHIGVTWLKTSLHSAPQMIYSSGNDVCKRTGSTCVYNLPMRNLSCDDAGTYFCVVTSCGRTMFGNGTRIDIHKTAVTKPPELSPTIIALMLSNIILGIVTLVLIWTICKIQRKDSTDAISESSEGNQSGAVTYEAVCLAPRSLPSKRVTVKYSEDSVVYSDIKDCQQNREVSSLEGEKTK